MYEFNIQQGTIAPESARDHLEKTKKEKEKPTPSLPGPEGCAKGIKRMENGLAKRDGRLVGESDRVFLCPPAPRHECMQLFFPVVSI